MSRVGERKAATMAPDTALADLGIALRLLTREQAVNARWRRTAKRSAHQRRRRARQYRRRGAGAGPGWEIPGGEDPCFGNLGAFVSFRGAMPPVVNIGTVCGVYLTPALHVAVSGMLTNTHCTSPYRGAGRPEASYMIERLIDIAADEMSIDPAELRRRNTIPPSAMPYKTPLTFIYDSGRF
jgi:Molybdopterin-binding domain of aldehyde dehydrogenase